MSIPFVLVGDLPGQPTGLSRILTDLAVRLASEVRDHTLDLEIACVGWAHWDHLPACGAPISETTLLDGFTHNIKCWGFGSSAPRWGRDALTTAYRSWFGDRRGIVLTIWDAHRCWGVMDGADLPVSWWGYMPVDAINVNGMVGGGPVAEALAKFDRLLAYTEFGARAISKTLKPLGPSATLNCQYRGKTERDMNRSFTTWEMLDVQHLPHGLNFDVFSPAAIRPASMTRMRQVFARTISADALLVGTVATNQPRKDWGMVAATLAELRARGLNVHGWWHTDQPVTDAWSLPQLVEDFDLQDAITLSTKLTDYELAAAYTCCAATIAPGRGEGFGYPIAESLAMGTPVVHADYAGGAELTPTPWRIPVTAYHLEGAYGLQRPVVSATAAADVIEAILRAAIQLGTSTHREHLPAFVAGLDWTTLWASWLAWVKEGL